MRIPAYSKKKLPKKKPWRNFRKNKTADRTIRKVCYSLLILEAAVFLSRSGLGELSVEQTRKEWMSPAPGGSSGEISSGEVSPGEISPGEVSPGVMERIFGVRLRLREGAVEFYRQEDIRTRVGE